MHRTRTRLGVRVAAVGVALTAAPAGADFLSVEAVETEFADGLVTYRLYAKFSDPADRLVAISGNPDVSALVFESSAPLHNDGGDFDGFMQEDFAAAPISGPRDSWVTIGHDEYAGNDTGMSPGLFGSDGVHRVIEGCHLTAGTGGWFDGDPGTPASGTSILIAQFTFPADGFEGFYLTGTVDWQPGGTGLVSDPFVVPTCTCAGFCPLDLTADDLVGFDDLLLFLSMWGPCECCDADFDHSGAVGIEDLLELLSNWGLNCCPGGSSPACPHCCS